jgi:hypothetical protein
MVQAFEKIKAVWHQRKHVIISSLIAVLYSLGGGGDKALRRFILPTVIAASFTQQHAWRRVLSILFLAVPLSLGYSAMIRESNWMMMIALGALMGLSWILLAGRQTIYTVAIMAVVFPCSIVINRFGIDWQFSELFVGAGYGLCYLIVKGDGLWTKR